MKKSFRSEKELRLFVKRMFKETLRGLPEEAKVEVLVKTLRPPKVYLLLPFYSEGNLIRAMEVDFFLGELYNFGVEGEIIYLDDRVEIEQTCSNIQS